VETLANIGQVILRGAKWYSAIGTDKSKGTKVFALTGDVNNVGLVEVPMGTSLGTIVYDIGGGIPKGKKFKAAQLGGPSGGMIPVEHLNASVDFDGTQFIIANADKYDWTNVRIKVNAGLLNNGYYLDTYTLKAGSVYTVGSMQFAKSDGTRFNPFQMKPRKVEISCDTPKGSGYYLARFE
jgi:hypothetical protein